MTIRLDGPRLLAISVLGALMGWISFSSQRDDVVRYKAMSHDSLIAALAQDGPSDLGTSVTGGLLMVLVLVLATDQLARFFMAVWRRIEPDPRDESAPRRPLE